MGNEIQGIGGLSSAWSSYAAAGTPSSGGAPFDPSALSSNAMQPQDGVQYSDELSEEGEDPQEVQKHQIQDRLKELDHKIKDAQRRLQQASENSGGEGGGDDVQQKSMQRDLDKLMKERGDLQGALSELTGGGFGGDGGGGGGGGLGGLVEKAAGGIGSLVSGLFG